MFAIYRKNVGGRIFDRYFMDYDNARTELKRDVDVCAKFGGKVTERIDRMNEDKGFWEYEVRMTTCEGEQASFAIVDGYFEDENN